MSRELHVNVEPLLCDLFLGDRLAFLLEAFEMEAHHLLKACQGFRKVVPVVGDPEHGDLGNNLARFGISGDAHPVLNESGLQSLSPGAK